MDFFPKKNPFFIVFLASMNDEAMKMRDDRQVLILAASSLRTVWRFTAGMRAHIKARATSSRARWTNLAHISNRQASRDYWNYRAVTSLRPVKLVPDKHSSVEDPNDGSCSRMFFRHDASLPRVQLLSRQTTKISSKIESLNPQLSMNKKKQHFTPNLQNCVVPHIFLTVCHDFTRKIVSLIHSIASCFLLFSSFLFFFLFISTSIAVTLIFCYDS